MKTSMKIIIAAGLFLAGSAVLAYQRVKRLQAIFERMTIEPHSLPKNVKLTLSQLSFDIDIRLVNPTGEDFAVSGYVATLRQVAVYFKNQFFGLANVNISEVEVPANNILVLRNVNLVVSTSTLLGSASEIITQLQSGAGIRMEDLQFTGVVEVLGSNYEIGTP